MPFASGFTDGKVLRFNVGRGVQHSSTVPNGTTSANYLGDLLGGGVIIPSGSSTQDGMTFSGTTSGGGTFTGVIRNRVNRGYSPLDGYGLLNAEAATGAAIP